MTAIDPLPPRQLGTLASRHAVRSVARLAVLGITGASLSLGGAPASAENAHEFWPELQAYFKAHGGRRVFFIVERSRYEQLKGLLPEAARPSMKIIDESNNKLYIASATLPAA